MLDSHNETYFGMTCFYEDADAVLFGAPFDSTTSFRPGARFASKIMRSESFGLESYSPYLERDLTDCSIFDSGDLELPFGNTERSLMMVKERVDHILLDSKLPVMIGGEHLVTLGALSAAVEHYPNLHVVHFDAHADLREHYLGETLSHATVMRRAWELLGDWRIHQFGIRSGEREEFHWARSHTFLRRFDFEGIDGALVSLRDKPVYLSIDLDVLDPSVFPGTGTPEAGGVSFLQLMEAMQMVCSLNVVGCDITELAPVYDPSGVSTATALKVLRELLLGLCSRETEEEE